MSIRSFARDPADRPRFRRKDLGRTVRDTDLLETASRAIRRTVVDGLNSRREVEIAREEKT
jgi:hypothetical protein